MCNICHDLSKVSGKPYHRQFYLARLPDAKIDIQDTQLKLTYATSFGEKMQSVRHTSFPTSRHDMIRLVGNDTESPHPQEHFITEMNFKW
jgi:hypothetical protein